MASEVRNPNSISFKLGQHKHSYHFPVTYGAQNFAYIRTYIRLKILSTHSSKQRLEITKIPVKYQGGKRGSNEFFPSRNVNFGSLQSIWKYTFCHVERETCLWIINIIRSKNLMIIYLFWNGLTTYKPRNECPTVSSRSNNINEKTVRRKRVMNP